MQVSRGGWTSGGSARSSLRQVKMLTKQGGIVDLKIHDATTLGCVNQQLEQQDSNYRVVFTDNVTGKVVIVSESPQHCIMSFNEYSSRCYLDTLENIERLRLPKHLEKFRGLITQAETLVTEIKKCYKDRGTSYKGTLVEDCERTVSETNREILQLTNTAVPSCSSSSGTGRSPERLHPEVLALHTKTIENTIVQLVEIKKQKEQTIPFEPAFDIEHIEQQMPTFLPEDFINPFDVPNLDYSDNFNNSNRLPVGFERSSSPTDYAEIAKSVWGDDVEGIAGIEGIGRQTRHEGYEGEIDAYQLSGSTQPNQTPSDWLDGLDGLNEIRPQNSDLNNNSQNQNLRSTAIVIAEEMGVICPDSSDPEYTSKHETYEQIITSILSTL